MDENSIFVSERRFEKLKKIQEERVSKKMLTDIEKMVFHSNENRKMLYLLLFLNFATFSFLIGVLVRYLM